MFPITCSLALGVAVPMPTLLPLTTKSFAAYLPATILLLLNTSNIGNPVMSFTLNKLPLKLSVTSNNVPLPPSTLSTLALLPLRYTCKLDTKLPVTPIPIKADPLSYTTAELPTVVAPVYLANLFTVPDDTVPLPPPPPALDKA